jgi:chemotaxis protein histidine kinase CheA
MPEPSAQQQREIAAFRLQYSQRLAARIVDIEAIWKLVCRGDAGESGVEELFFKLHNLHGSAATCGFAAVSQLAGELEAIVKSVRDARSRPTPEQRVAFARRINELERARENAPRAQAPAASSDARPG